MEPNYRIVRSKKRKKTISLHVNEDGTVVVYAPGRTPIAEIDRFCREKKTWLWKKIRETRERHRETRTRKFAEGETFFFLGEPHPLKINATAAGSESLVLLSGQFVLTDDKISKGRDVFVEWYKTRAQEYIQRRVDHFSQILGLCPRGIRISNARCRWGSCSQDDRLYFSWRLIMATPSIIDYVVVHELAHMKEKNHSRCFWKLVAKNVPDYMRQRIWLRDYGQALDI